jgi:hypothetical protein
LIWDARNVERLAKPRPTSLPARRLDKLWQDLAGADAAQAYQAIEALAAGPQSAVPFLRERLRPVPQISNEVLADISRFIKELDSDRYVVRRNASRQLERLGPLAEPAVRKLLAGKPSLEVQLRAEALLAKWRRRTWSAEELQTLRAIEVLERIGSAAAGQVLRELTRGEPSAWLTQDAQAALERLARRPAASQTGKVP